MEKSYSAKPQPSDEDTCSHPIPAAQAFPSQVPNTSFASLPQCSYGLQQLAHPAPRRRARALNLGRSRVHIHRMQQPIRTPRARARVRLVARAHQKNREITEEARSGEAGAWGIRESTPRRIPRNHPVFLAVEWARTWNRKNFVVGSDS